MLHLSPESGLWLPCSKGDDGKCELLYHAPVEEEEISDALLWEMYASEELYRKPDQDEDGIKMWFKNEMNHRDYNLPAIIVEKDNSSGYKIRPGKYYYRNDVIYKTEHF